MYPHVFDIPEAILFRSPLPLEHSLVLPKTITAKYGAGALGFAMIGKTGDPAVALALWEREVTNRNGNAIEAIAHILGIPEDLVTELYRVGVRDGIPAGTIADRLSQYTVS